MRNNCLSAGNLSSNDDACEKKNRMMLKYLNALAASGEELWGTIAQK